MILDSSFLIHIEAEYQPALEKARDLEASGLPIRIPQIVLYEMFVSVGAGNHSDENRNKIEAVLSGYPTVTASESIMKRAGRFDGEIIREYGAPIGPGDAIIASTAIELDEPLVTDNVRDFEKVPSDALEIVTY